MKSPSPAASICNSPNKFWLDAARAAQIKNEDCEIGPDDLDYQDDNRSIDMLVQDAWLLEFHYLTDTAWGTQIAPSTLHPRLSSVKEMRRLEGLAAAPKMAAAAAAEAASSSDSAEDARISVGINTAQIADPQASGLGLAFLALTPRILAQRPITARVRAGLLTT